MRMFFVLFLFIAVSCSTLKRNQKEIPPDQINAQNIPEPLENPPSLDQRVYLLESKLLKLQEKLDSLNASSHATQVSQAKTNNGLDPSITTARGKVFNQKFSESPEVLLYKEAKILFDAQKINEAQLSFSQFLNKYSDHPLSPSATYHLGLCALALKEWASAKETFEKLLVQYPYSSHTSDGLKNLIHIELQMNNPKQSEMHEQTLLTLFPQSPAAHSILELKSKDSIKPTETTPLKKDGA